MNLVLVSRFVYYAEAVVPILCIAYCEVSLGGIGVGVRVY